MYFLIFFFNVENSIKREMRKIFFSKKKNPHPPPPPGFFFYTNYYYFFNVGNSMKREENKKYWKKNLKILFFSIFKKFKQHSINIKNYTAHPHDLVHVPAKFRENTSMRFLVTVRKLNVTDRQTDGRTDRRTDGQTDGRTGGVAISPVPGLRRRGR